MNPQEFQPQEREQHQPVIGGNAPPQVQNPGGIATDQTVQQSVVAPNLPSSQPPIAPTMPVPPQATQAFDSTVPQPAPVVGSVTPANPNPQQPMPAFMQPSQPQASYNTQSAKRPRKKLALVVLVAVLLLGGGLGGAYFLRSSADPA